jgi:hypothetical protein
MGSNSLQYRTLQTKFCRTNQDPSQPAIGRNKVSKANLLRPTKPSIWKIPPLPMCLSSHRHAAPRDRRQEKPNINHANDIAKHRSRSDFRSQLRESSRWDQSSNSPCFRARDSPTIPWTNSERFNLTILRFGTGRKWVGILWR